MKLYIFTAILSFGLFSQGQQPSAADADKMYINLCGGIEAVAKENNVKVSDLTPKMVAAVQQNRTLFLDAIRLGAPLFESTGGSFYDKATMINIICPTLLVIEDKIKATGCLDLNTQVVVKEGSGFDYCKVNKALIQAE